eukprot:scaffold1272_cov250-Pinguiococcus_pyrenoidosus.AAC.63
MPSWYSIQLCTLGDLLKGFRAEDVNLLQTWHFDARLLAQAAQRRLQEQHELVQRHALALVKVEDREGVDHLRDQVHAAEHAERRQVLQPINISVLADIHCLSLEGLSALASRLYFSRVPHLYPEEQRALQGGCERRRGRSRDPSAVRVSGCQTRSRLQPSWPD